MELEEKMGSKQKMEPKQKIKTKKKKMKKVETTTLKKEETTKKKIETTTKKKMKKKKLDMKIEKKKIEAKKKKKKPKNEDRGEEGDRDDVDENEDRVEKKMKMKIEWKKTIQVESPRGWAATGALHRPAPPAFHLSPGRDRALKGDVHGTRWAGTGTALLPCEGPSIRETRSSRAEVT